MCRVLSFVGTATQLELVGVRISEVPQYIRVVSPKPLGSDTFKRLLFKISPPPPLGMLIYLFAF
jgi:hypothetical protein